MLKSHIDIILFIAFLGVNLLVGLLAGRRVKNIRDFSIGNKDFSTATVTSTIVATWISGGFMFYGLKNIYTDGLQFIIPLLGLTLCLLVTGRVLAIRMGEFLSNLSVAESMGHLYGPIVRTITAISGILMAIGSMAMQFQVIAKILTLLLGVQGPWVTVTAASIVILYSAFGGIRSVLITDLLQFIVFIIFIPILALVVWNHLKNPTKVAATLAQNPIFNFKEVVGWNSKFLSSLGMMLYFIIPGMNPPIFQRIAMARNLKQIKDSFTYAAGITFLMVLSVAWIAILLLADKPGLDPNNLVNYIITEYAYVGLKGLIAIGITSMAMSTADSYLNSAAVLAVNDIIKPLKTYWKESITLVRLFSLIFGIFALLLAIHITDLLELLLLSGSFYMPIVTVPLLLAIFGFRSTKRAVLIGMVAGFITVVLWDKVLGDIGLNKLIPGMLANLIFFMGSHYILREKGGWVGIQVKEPLIAARQSRRAAWVSLTNTIKNTNLYEYLQKNLPAYEVVYSFFAIYIIGATYVSFYTIPETIVASYQKLYDFAAHSVLIATAGFLTYPAWPPTFKGKRFISFAWPAGIFYILFVVGTMLVIMSGFHEVQVMVFMLNLILAVFLLSWPLMLIISSLGILVGSLLFHLYYGPIHFTGAVDSMQFKAIYIMLLLGSFLIALFRFKQSKETLQKKNAYLMTLNNQSKEEMEEVLRYREEILKDLTKEDTLLFDETMTAYMRQAIYRMTDYMRLDAKRVSMEELISELKESIELTDFPQMDLVIHNKSKQSTIEIDLERIKQMLVNSITYLHNRDAARPITIVLEDTKLGYSVAHMQNYARESDALRIVLTTDNPLPELQPIYNLNHNSIVDQVARDSSRRKLLQNARIVDAHYGYAELDSPATHLYVIPINLREVRGKVMEIIREPAVMDPAELSHPLSIKVEEELKHKLAAKGIDLKPISKALNVIKRYHAGVKRKSGEPFFTHPINVALILLEYCQDPDAVIAALLHDTVEDTGLSLVQIKIMFGETVAFLVQKVTNLEENRKRLMLEDHENIARLINYEDKRAAYVKLADRMHNMRTISGHSSLAKQKHIASETLNFFVPLAKNLELTAVSEELEKLSLEVLKKR